MAKKAKNAVISTSYASMVSFNAINDVISTHNNRVDAMIKRHLDAVASNTGDLLPEDVAYVINLSNRELGHAIKKLFQPNVL
jgi:hypothetical protein